MIRVSNLLSDDQVVNNVTCQSQTFCSSSDHSHRQISPSRHVLERPQLRQAEDAPSAGHQPTQAAREKENGAGTEGAQGDRRLHRRWKVGKGQDQGRADHQGGLPGRGDGNRRNVLRPDPRQIRPRPANEVKIHVLKFYMHFLDL
jgi:SRSO17 transposase